MNSAIQPTSRKPISVLVIQMGEIEEVFRSLMALKAIQYLYPEVKIHFVCRRSVSAPVKRVNWISSLIETPAFETENESVPAVAQWIDSVIRQKYDISINWTYSDRYVRMGAVMTSLIPALVKLGEFVRDDSTLGAHDAWSSFRRSWLKSDIQQDIHHTDIITTQLLTALQIHAGDPNPDAGIASVSTRYFFQESTQDLPAEWLKRQKSYKWVAVQAETLGQRSEELVDMVLRRHPDAGVVLLGENASADSLADQVADHPVGRLIDLRGKLHMDPLVNVLSQSQWLMASTSPLIDLASLMNVRCFSILQGIESPKLLKWTESGPYGNGHVVLTTSEEWNPESVYGVWSYYQGEWFHKGSFNLESHFANIGISKEWETIRVYRSRIRSPSDGGGVCYERIGSKLQTSFEEWMFRLKGQMARSWFCGWIPHVDSEMKRFHLNPELVKRVRAAKESFAVLQKVSAEGREVSRSLKRLAIQLKQDHLMSVEDRDLIDQHGKKLLEIEALISRVIQVEPELYCFLKWYQQLIANLKGDSIAQMATESEQAFEMIHEGVELLELYAQKTMQSARPKSVESPILLQMDSKSKSSTEKNT